METTQKQIVLGILAHVDSGKTTLSEAMLYRAGAIRKLGRVDHGDAFLDTDSLEKARGITIFSKQALLTAGNTAITLLDTPGHVDFSTETERTLQVLDYAVLVVSGTDGVQSHTETLWRLLRRYHVPTFVFVNKMDLPGMTREQLLSQLNHRLGEGFVDFGAEPAARNEALALCDEQLMEKMLDAGTLTDADIIPAVARRHVFPCWFGAALRLDGVDALLDGLDRYTRPAPALHAFGARVFKVSQDEQGARLTWLRVTGGELKVKALLTGETDGEPWAEKANQLRLYSGAKYTLTEAIGPGQVCAVTGLTHAKPGTGLGAERDSDVPVLEPVLSYQVLLPEGADVHAALAKLHRLEEEEPQLHVVWNETLGEIHVQLMGEVQLEVLRSLLAEEKCDIFCTGSNAQMLSGELATHLAGRSVSFDVHSLSYREFLTFHRLEAGQESLRKYLTFGGMPYLAHIGLEADVPFEYLRSVYSTILLKDTVAREKIRNVHFLEDLVAYLADNIGNLFSANNISKFLKSQRVDLSPQVTLNYLRALSNAYLIHRVSRAEVGGLKIFETGEKFYFEDIGISHAIRGFNFRRDIHKVMENAVYLHLIQQGYSVHVGQLKEQEIDFVADKSGDKLYVQVSLSVADEKTATREFGNLLAVQDNYPKYVVTLNDIILGDNQEGIRHMNLEEFLLNEL